MILLRYTMLRIMLFAGVLAVLLLFDVDILWAAVAAALVSMVISFFLQRPDRERIAAGIDERVQQRVERRRAKIDSERMLEDDAAAEDAEIGEIGETDRPR